MFKLQSEKKELSAKHISQINFVQISVVIAASNFMQMKRAWMIATHLLFYFLLFKASLMIDGRKMIWSLI